MPAEQLTFFPSLDFPGRTTLMVWEIAERLGVSCQHLFNEIDTGSLVVVDLKAAQSNRRCARVPVEAYRNYILARLSGPNGPRLELLRTLPAAVRRDLIAELEASLRLSP